MLLKNSARSRLQERNADNPGESGERQLLHKDGEAERFYRDLKLRGISVRVGIEATGHARWFERLLAELGFELWIGDPAQVKPHECGSRRPIVRMRSCC